MGNHYIPQFYLRGFCSAAGKLWTHDRLTEKSFETQPKAVANENAMYSEELEQQLNNQIEDPANRAIAKIREQQALTDTDRVALARYVVSLWKRVPAARARVAKRLPQVVASVRQDIHDGLNATARVDPKRCALVEQRKDDVDRIIAQYAVANPPPDIWQSILATESTPRVLDALLSMDWRFLVSSQAELLTCDNPVFFFPHEGIGPPTAELSVPLSSDIALWATRRPSSGPIFVPALPIAARELNRRTAHNATRFVYSASNAAWIAPFLWKTEYRLTRLR